MLLYVVGHLHEPNNPYKEGFHWSIFFSQLGSRRLSHPVYKYRKLHDMEIKKSMYTELTISTIYRTTRPKKTKGRSNSSVVIYQKSRQQIMMSDIRMPGAPWA